MLDESRPEGRAATTRPKPLRRAWKRRAPSTKPAGFDPSSTGLDSGERSSARRAWPTSARSSAERGRRRDGDGQTDPTRRPSCTVDDLEVVRRGARLRPRSPDRRSGRHPSRCGSPPKAFATPSKRSKTRVERALTALIEEVTALQDAAGEMHDAIVAAERARTLMPRQCGLDPPNATPSSAFARRTGPARRGSAARRSTGGSRLSGRTLPALHSANVVVALAGEESARPGA